MAKSKTKAKSRAKSKTQSNDKARRLAKMTIEQLLSDEDMAGGGFSVI